MLSNKFCGKKKSQAALERFIRFEALIMFDDSIWEVVVTGRRPRSVNSFVMG